MTQVLLVLFAFLFLLITTAFDVLLTNRGIKAGVGVEGNSWIVRLFGDKPKLFDVALYEAVRCLMIAALLFAWDNPALFGACIGTCIAAGGKHIQGALKWRLLLSGKPLPVKSSLTAWEKFLGWFGYTSEPKGGL